MTTAARLMTLGLTLGAYAGATMADGTLVRLNNLTDTTIIRLYVSPSGTKDWGGDLLSSGMLGPLESMEFDNNFRP